MHSCIVDIWKRNQYFYFESFIKLSNYTIPNQKSRFEFVRNIVFILRLVTPVM